MKMIRWIGIAAALAVAALVVIIIAVLPQFRQTSGTLNCASRMYEVIGAANRWATRNGGRLPSDFRSMAGDLTSTAILICPRDESRHKAADWPALNETSCSYEILEPGLINTNIHTPYLKCKVHRHSAHPSGTISGVQL